LSSTDWTTFNNKANALSGTNNYIAKFTSSSAIGNSSLQDDGITITSTSSIYVNKANPFVRFKGSTLDAYIINSNDKLYIADFNTATKNIVLDLSTGATTFSSSVYASRALFDSDFLSNETSKVGIGFAGGYAQFNSWGANTSTYGGFKFQISVSNGGTYDALKIAPSSAATFASSVTATQLITKSSSGAGALNLKDGSAVDKWEIGHISNALYFYNYTGGNTSMTIVGSSSNILMGTSSDNGERLYVSGAIRATGTITANSDITLKKNLLKIENALEKVEQINGYTYEFKEDDSKRHAGVIAQEIQTVLPEIVNKGNDGILGVEYGNISALLIEAIKEQQTQINELKALLNK
jgi:hypothetical protein